MAFLWPSSSQGLPFRSGVMTGSPTQVDSTRFSRGLLMVTDFREP